MLGYDVPLGGPVSRRTALNLRMSRPASAGQLKPMSTYRLQNLLSPRSVAWSGGAHAKVPSGGPFSGIFTRRNSKANFGLVNTHYPEIDGVATVDSVCTENLIRVDIT